MKFLKQSLSKLKKLQLQVQYICLSLMLLTASQERTWLAQHDGKRRCLYWQRSTGKRTLPDGTMPTSAWYTWPIKDPDRLPWTSLVKLSPKTAERFIFAWKNRLLQMAFLQYPRLCLDQRTIGVRQSPDTLAGVTPKVRQLRVGEPTQRHAQFDILSYGPVSLWCVLWADISWTEHLTSPGF